jgi:phage-related protein
MHNLSYGGINSEDYKVFITNAGIYKSPEKRYKEHTVPGRSGKVLEDTGTFENIEVEYPICVYEDSDNNLQAFLAAMLRKKGYQRIEDTFHPEYYRMGAFLDEYEPKRVTEDAEMSNGVIKFKCLPQKWLKSGEEPMYFCAHDAVQAENIPSGNVGLSTSLMPIPEGREMKFTTYRIEDETVYFRLTQYDGFGHVVGVIDGVFGGEPYTMNVEFEQDAEKWVMYLYSTDSDNLDAAYILFEFTYNLEAVDTVISAYFKNNITIENPTGFFAKPLIEYILFDKGTLKITNDNTDGTTDYYELEITQGRGGVRVFVDCDMQYVYDTMDENMSDRIRIITAQDSKGESLVFPRFGDGNIALEFKRTETVLSYSSPNIVAIYPRWWTV